MRNRIQCLICKDIIESKYRHDYVTCSCGNVSVDGGQDYCKVNSKTINWKAVNDEDLMKGVVEDELRKRKQTTKRV